MIQLNSRKNVALAGIVAVTGLVVGIHFTSNASVGEPPVPTGVERFVSVDGFVSETGMENGTMPLIARHPDSDKYASTSVSILEPIVVTEEGEQIYTPECRIFADAYDDVAEASQLVEPLEISLDTAESLTGPGNGFSEDNVESISLDIESIEVSADDTVMDIYEVMAYGVPQTVNTEVLLECVNPDPNYEGQPLNLTGANRDNFYRLVMGEAGAEGFEGAALVAQALKDTMLMTGNTDTLSIKRSFGYSGSLKKAPNEDVIRAVDFVLGGGSAVQHRIIYFYAPHIVKSRWHETQNFVIEWGGHRVFDKV